MATLRNQEIPHNTPEQVRDYLTAALELVETLEVPSDLREAAFSKAVDLTSGKNILVEQVGVNLGGLQLPPQG